MNIIHISLLKILTVFILAVAPLLTASAITTVPAGIDHEPLDALLQKYVDDKGLINYTAWHASSEDVEQLKSYLAQFAPEGMEVAQGNELIASLINAYNGFTIEFILDNFPTESIRTLDQSI
ncbi:MAG: hypothetical protein WD490_02085 [Opitutales bacterium]